MQTFAILTPFFLLTIARPSCCSDYFGYSLAEQSLWQVNYPECGGQRQSPIQLNRTKATHSKHFPLIFKGYNDVLPPLTLTNTGHTVSLSIDPRAITHGVRIPSITSDKLKDEYEFVSLHLHWGRGNAFGSEHLIGRLLTPLELHIVHKRSSNAIERRPRKLNEFAVLGVLFSFAKASGNELKPIFSHLKAVREFNSTTSVQGTFTLASFLGNLNIDKFYQYEGSLTTPPCTESVAWFVFGDLLSCTASQLRQLRKLRTLDKKGNPTRILENHRATQPLNNRNINFYHGNLRATMFTDYF